MNICTKKNKVMRVGIAAVVATMLSVCVCGGVFAKYATSATGSDTAHVAHWGWGTSTLELGNLFSTQYAGATDGSGNTVAGSADVIAPGTAGQATIDFAYSGINGVTAPEVAYEFTVNVDATCSPTIKANKNIQWALKAENESPKDSDYKTWTEMISALKSIDGTDGNGGTTYQAGTLPKSSGNAELSSYTIYWRWNYSDGSSPVTYWKSGNEIKTENPEDSAYTEMTQAELDTYMGNLDPADSLSIGITITAEQVD